VLVLVLGSWALTVIPAHAGIQKGRRHKSQRGWTFSAGVDKYKEPSRCTKGGHTTG